MAKKSSNDEVYRGERWRVMWIAEDGKIKEEKYDDEFEAKQHYFSIKFFNTCELSSFTKN